jgi:hypothetical protein
MFVATVRKRLTTKFSDKNAPIYIDSHIYVPGDPPAPPPRPPVTLIGKQCTQQDPIKVIRGKEELWHADSTTRSNEQAGEYRTAEKSIHKKGKT